jgi:Zn finger protein HypA/HybF involved in hydrogenase expression
MHEYGLAQEIAKRLKAEAERAGARRIIAVDIEVGGSLHASADNIAFWVKESLGEELGKDATVRAVRAPASLFCPDCKRRSSRVSPDNEEWGAHLLPARCPHCGSSRVRVKGDTGCLIRHLELER